MLIWTLLTHQDPFLVYTRKCLMMKSLDYLFEPANVTTLPDGEHVQNLRIVLVIFRLVFCERVAPPRLIRSRLCLNQLGSITLYFYIISLLQSTIRHMATANVHSLHGLPIAFQLHWSAFYPLLCSFCETINAFF